MEDRPETPEERLQRRRVRRWKRRARILGPFLGVPILVAALSLSVDLIEYRPQPPRERLTDRPIRLTPRAVRRSIDQIPVSPSPRPIQPAIQEDDLPLSTNDTRDLDVMLPSTTAASDPLPPPPTPPSALLH